MGVILPSGEQIEIAFGDQEATIVGVGAGLRTYSVGGRDLLDDEPSKSAALGERKKLHLARLRDRKERVRSLREIPFDQTFNR